MPATRKLSQSLAVLAKVDPVSQAAGAVNLGAVDMARYEHAVFVLHVGAVGAAGTVDMKIQSSATSGGTYADLSPAKAITQIVAANKVAIIEVYPSDLPSTARFAQAVVTVGTNAVLIEALAYASDGKFKPENGDNIAAVTQTVN